MVVFNGKSVFGGIAIGKLFIYRRKPKYIKCLRIDDIEAETEKFETAKKTAISQLDDLYQKAVLKVGEEDARIFEIQKMMIEDVDFCDSVINIIKVKHFNAEYAVFKTAEKFSRMIASMEDEYIRERAADIADISRRLLDIMTNAPSCPLCGNEPVIIGADDLAPSETVQIDKSMVLGFVTSYGSSCSHTAILARTMNIPAVTNIGNILRPEFDGSTVIVDGFAGKVYISPDEKTMGEMLLKMGKENIANVFLPELASVKTATLDGQEIEICANASHIKEIDEAAKTYSSGVGLFRTEFLHFERDSLFDEEKQFELYKSAVQKMGGKRLVIRTIEIDRCGFLNGKDKWQLILETQLRAILRASAFGQVDVMFPSIVSVGEARKNMELLQKIKFELESKGITYSSNIKAGIMIETPAAVMISDILAREADFFSIGTNDLMQYTFASGMQSTTFHKTYDPDCKAILRMIKMAADNAHANGIKVGICGELASDLSLTETFLSMGIDELSVAPVYVQALRKKVLETNVANVKNIIIDAIAS